jgi:hypothetical protein
MLERGVRQYIVDQMSDRPIGGLIHRSYLPDYGPCLIIRVSGTPVDLKLFENSVLYLTDEEDRSYWQYTKVYKPDESLAKLISVGFSIGQSTVDATRGPNSDPQYDHKSEQSSTKTGRSSKSGN